MVMQGYFETHAKPYGKRRGKRRGVNLNDPHASKADKDYKEDYGL